jgi:SAM-dependent methyltransferase
MSNPSPPPATERLRQGALGEHYSLQFVDRLGIWFSAREIRKAVRDFRGLRVADIGCGYDARFVRTILGSIRSAVLADVTLSPQLKSDPRVKALEGHLPGVMDAIDAESQDLVMCISVLEHLWDPLVALKHLRRITAPGGICLFSVPTWRGKWALETAAFRLHTSKSAPEEMDDHKMYYDLRDFWPLLVQAGFLPHQIRCYRYKFGIGLFTICKLS